MIIFIGNTNRLMTEVFLPPSHKTLNFVLKREEINKQVGNINSLIAVLKL